MKDKIRIGISSCLLGNNVRYDGGHKQDHFLTDTLGRYVEWFPVCPEVEYGLPVPREPMRLTGDPDAPRLRTIRSGIDHTEGMQGWARAKMNELKENNLCGFIFKSRSPSSGYKGVKVYSSSGRPSRKGTGIFARAFIDQFPLIPVEDEGRLNDPKIRENFIERVFIMKRWKRFLAEDPEIKNLISFHTDHKYLILSHSPKHSSLLGSMLADAKNYQKDELFKKYITVLMEGLSLIATTRKNTNVLMHIAGYFKKRLTRDEKAELLEIIENYHEGIIPLVVPVTLINHYIRKFDEPYLKRQHYLSPHPAELMLRNHV